MDANSKNIIKKYWKDKERNLFYVKSKFFKSKSVLISVSKGEELLVSKNNGGKWDKILKWDFEYNPDKRILAFLIKEEIKLFKWSFTYWRKYKLSDYRLTKIDIEGKTFCNLDGTPNYKVEDGNLYHYIDNQWILTSTGNNWHCDIHPKDDVIYMVWSEKSKTHPNKHDIKCQKDLTIYDVLTC